MSEPNSKNDKNVQWAIRREASKSVISGYDEPSTTLWVRVVEV
jgi:hypothetical protein